MVDDDFTNIPVALLQGTLYNLIRFGDKRVNISIVFGALLFYGGYFFYRLRRSRVSGNQSVSENHFLACLCLKAGKAILLKRSGLEKFFKGWMIAMYIG